MPAAEDISRFALHIAGAILILCIIALLAIRAVKIGIGMVHSIKKAPEPKDVVGTIRTVDHGTHAHGKCRYCDADATHFGPYIAEVGSFLSLFTWLLPLGFIPSRLVRKSGGWHQPDLCETHADMAHKKADAFIAKDLGRLAEFMEKRATAVAIYQTTGLDQDMKTALGIESKAVEAPPAIAAPQLGPKSTNGVSTRPSLLDGHRLDRQRMGGVDRHQAVGTQPVPELEVHDRVLRPRSVAVVSTARPEVVAQLQQDPLRLDR